jgi:Cytochrome P460
MSVSVTVSGKFSRRREGLIAVIVGNPVMIDAYKEGVPGNGKTVPDGAKMAKIHWNPKKQEAYLGSQRCQGPNMTLISW